MFTGALAASYYGTPRTTMDIDLVAKVGRGEPRTKLISALKVVGLEVDRRKIDAALRSGYGIVTLRDTKTPFTVDIILSNKRLEKNAGSILGLPTFYQTPEGLILAKLRMIKATFPRERALKDENDVRAILRHTSVKMNALRKQAQKDNTMSILRAIASSDPRKPSSQVRLTGQYATHPQHHTY